MGTPRVLDLDMDLFVSEVVYWPQQDRPDPEHYMPWPEERVQEFLERCGLSTQRRVRGRRMTDHDEVFYAWRDLINTKELEPPFDVVHADAHVDIGLGNANYVQLMTEHLHLPVEKRSNPPQNLNAMNAGSYLIYAVACHWISSITYVHHETGANDLLILLPFKDFAPGTRSIQLKKCRPDWRPSPPLPRREDILDVEPEIPFTPCSVTHYVADTPFDFVFVSWSPKYFPETGDHLMSTVMSYIEEF